MPAGSGRLEHLLKVVGVVVTVGSLLLALGQFLVSQSVQARTPLLEKKLEWCVEATDKAAAIAVRQRAGTAAQETRFWELYWGLMGMVENTQVTRAMVAFGNGLNGLPPEGKSLQQLSLDIAHACRDELARDWSILWRR